jgi:hypothetical protein
MYYDKQDDKKREWFMWIIWVVIILVIVGIVLTVLFAPPTPTVGKATSFGTLATYEEMSNGAVRVWLQGNDTAVYCTDDPALINRIKEYGGQPVIVEYATVLQSECIDPNINDNRTNSEPVKTVYQLTQIIRTAEKQPELKE